MSFHRPRPLAVSLFALTAACASRADAPAESPSGTPADAVAPPKAGEASPGLTLERMLSAPSLTGTSPGSVAWSPDSRRLAFLWNESAQPRRHIWIVDADGSGLRRLTNESEEAGGVSRFAGMPDSAGIVYQRAGALWRTSLDGEDEPLTDVPSGASGLRVSPGGRFASFLQGGDLWLFEFGTGTLEQVTEVGVDSVSTLPLGRYRRPEVEIGPYVWGGPTYAWSPDGETIAVHYVDRRNMPLVPFPNYLGEETDPNLVRRGYPGGPNETRKVGLFRIEDGELTFLDLPDPTSTRVVDFSWSSNGKLLVDRESDTAVERWLHVVDPTTGDAREIWSDERESRIYTSIGSAWHPDGEHVVFLSDLEDRYGLFLWGPEMASPRRLTTPEFDVTGVPHVVEGAGVEGAGAIFFQSNEPSPYERHVFRIPQDGGEATRLTTLAGLNQPYPSPDGKTLAFLHSDDRSPTELYLVRGDGPEQRITTSPPPEFEEHSWANARYVTFPSRIDDYTLHARILEPRDLDRSQRYPVIFGPVYSNTVRNRWSGRNGLLHQVLVDKGYLVVQVDVRGSTGYEGTSARSS